MKKYWFFVFAFIFSFGFSGTYFLLTALNSNEAGQTENIVLQEKSENSFSLDEAPTASLKGKILLLTGDVEWQSRTATESSKINSVQEIQQGERLVTGETGLATLSFENELEVSVYENSDIDVIQTLPANLVFKQNEGDVLYSKSGTNPLTVRVMHLIIYINGETEIIKEKDKNTIYVISGKGTTDVYYNDLNLNVKTLSVNEGSTLIFNDDIRRGVLE